MILSRTEFAVYFNTLRDGLGDPDSPLWSQESNHGKCHWFIKVKPIHISDRSDRKKFWNWCDSTMTGRVLCYSSDSIDNEEWWGFSNKDDIVMWTLRWATAH